MAILHLIVLLFNAFLFVGISLGLLESSIATSAAKMVVRGDQIDDRHALLELKRQTYDPDRQLSSWNDSIHYCNWVGIICGSRHQQRVISLDLQGKGLGGNLSPSVGNLTFLRYLNIKNNSFSGKIPQEIGNLIRLRNLTFNNNSFEGEIPANLANCTSLRNIFLSHNNLVGKIPVELSLSLSKLEFLSINHNGLTGKIPDSFGNISSLKTISLIENELQGSIPESFGQLTNLERLAFAANNLSGTLPVSLYNLSSSLKAISLALNQLHGSLRQDIGIVLPKLELLAVGTNHFSGSIPSSISNFSKLEIIDLGSNNFVGPIPKNLGNLQNLRWFSIEENYCAAGEDGDLNFLNTLVNCTNLKVLELEQNGFRGPIPNFKANLSTQLSILYLGQNQISGTIPSEIENLINLTALELGWNFLEGIIPISLGKLPKLQRLTLAGNMLSGQLHPSIGNLTALYRLNLGANNLNGSIPSDIGNCQKLQYLTLSSNHFQGPIPTQLFHISSLSIILDLSSNFLVGSLPIEIGSLKSLTTIDISKNKLSKKIPSSIGDCNSLEHLYMGSNFFEGTIPQSLALLKGLSDLDLSHNNLSGQIPRDLQNLLALQGLNLSFNNLEGEIPTKGVFGNGSAILVNGNDKLCGGIVELHLPACINSGSMKGGKPNVFKIAFSTIGVILGFLLISSFLVSYWTRRSRGNPPSAPIMSGPFLHLSYKELFQATRGFSSASFIGSGGFGYVYKGIINPAETIVAVKVLNLQNPRAHKSFMAECEALKNIRHRNLVKILDSCSSLDSKGEAFKALVFEFMPNGSLDDWLHSHSRNLSLLQRLDIALDVASALDYLHHHCYVTIVHCDLKPSNILLDNDMVAHVGDFGLARLLLKSDEENSSQDQISTIGIKGSIGYIAPEYGMGGSPTIEGDVFSFGILLLEMLTRRRPTDEMFCHDFNLHNFAKAALPVHVMNILDSTLLPRERRSENVEMDFMNRTEDPCLKIDELQGCIISIIEVALQCSMESPKERLSMEDVAKRLHVIKEKFF